MIKSHLEFTYKVIKRLFQKEAICIIALIFQLISTEDIAFSQNNQNKAIDFTITNSKINQFSLDSIFSVNQLCQRFNETAKMDSFFWDQYPSINPNSIPLLKENSAHELFKLSLNLKNSNKYSELPFNLFGTYQELEYKNDLNTYQGLKTKVKVYDVGFTKEELVRAQTQKCEELSKIPDFPTSIFDSYMLAMGAPYSNLYYILDLDFLRMYYVPYSDDLVGDRRIWSKNHTSGYDATENYDYHRVFKKDSSIFVVLVSESIYSIFDQMIKRKSIQINYNEDSGKYLNDVQKIIKYIVINLNTKSIEKIMHYHFSYNNDTSIIPNLASFYESSYMMKEGKYYLKDVILNKFRFNPAIDDISLGGISFHVDSVISDQKKVERINNHQADKRDENYINQTLRNTKRYGNGKY